MKKFLFFLCVALFLFVQPSAFAGSYVQRIVEDSGNAKIWEFVVSGSGATAIPIAQRDVYGLWLYSLETIPASSPTAYTVAVNDADSFAILNLSARSTTAKEYASGSETLGQFPRACSALSIAVGDLGSGTTTIRVQFLR